MSGCAKGLRTVLAAVLVGTLGSVAWAWPWDKKDTAVTDCELRAIIKQPKEFLQRDVTFLCRFAMPGNLFKNFSTQFNAYQHLNFSVWPIDAKLWDKAERRNVLPSLYVDKSNFETSAELAKAKRYELLRVRGQVVSNYGDLPWILITEAKRVSERGPLATDADFLNVKQGLDLQAAGKPAEAAKYLRMALDGGLPGAHRDFVTLRLSESLGASGDLAGAEALLAKSVRGDEPAPQVTLALARLRLGHNDGRGAIAALKNLGDRQPPEAHALLAEAYGLVGENEQALAECDRAVAAKLTGDLQTGVEVSRARALAALGRYADAIRSYAQAIAPGGPLADAAWLHREVGRLYESRYDATGKLDLLAEAEARYQAARDLERDRDPESLFLAARCAYKRARQAGTDQNEAQRLLKSCQALANDYAPARGLAGELALASGDLVEAEKQLAAAVSAGQGGTETRQALAEVYVQTGQVEAAAKEYAAVAAQDPGNRPAREKLAALAEKGGRWDTAERYYGELVKLAPGEPEYRLKLGRSQLELGESAAAAENLILASRESGSLGEQAFVALAKLRDAAGDEAGAEAAWRGALERNPRNLTAARELAYLLASLDREPAECLLLAGKAAEGQAGDGRTTLVLGCAQVRAGETELGVKTLEQVPVVAMDRLGWCLLGQALLGLDRPDEARLILAKAVRPAAAGESTVRSQRVSRAAGDLLAGLGATVPPATPTQVQPPAPKVEMARQTEPRPAVKPQPAPVETAAVAKPAPAKQPVVVPAVPAAPPAPVAAATPAKPAETSTAPRRRLWSWRGRDHQEAARPQKIESAKPAAETKPAQIAEVAVASSPEPAKPVRPAETVIESTPVEETIPGLPAPIRATRSTTPLAQRSFAPAEAAPELEDKGMPRPASQGTEVEVPGVQLGSKPADNSRPLGLTDIMGGEAVSRMAGPEPAPSRPISRAEVDVPGIIDLGRVEALSAMAGPARAGNDDEHSKLGQPGSAGRNANWQHYQSQVNGAEVLIEEELPRNEIRDLPEWAR